jgi:hypothetical protein
MSGLLQRARAAPVKCLSERVVPMHSCVSTQPIPDSAQFVRGEPVSRILSPPLPEIEDHSSLTGCCHHGSCCLPGTLDQSRPAWNARIPYSALLPVGLAMRPLLPAARWAFTPPFHPCRPRGRRFVFCGAIRQVALPGRYPAPSLCGVRTFLGAGEGFIQTSARGLPALRARFAYEVRPVRSRAHDAPRV